MQKKIKGHGSGEGSHFSPGPPTSGPASKPSTGGAAVAAAQVASEKKDDTAGHGSGPAVELQGLGQAVAQSTQKPRPRPSPAVSGPQESKESGQNASTGVNGQKENAQMPNGKSSKPTKQKPKPEGPQATATATDKPPLRAHLSPDVDENQQKHLRLSTSPPRFAHFSDEPLPDGELHQPPPRQLSPVKPALKYHTKDSLSPDGRPARTGPPGSEISDGTSVASDDGSRPNRKKSVKVSFDDEAEVVGVAASPPTSPEDATSDSTPTKKSKAHWFPVGKKKTSHHDFADDEYDELLKPRAALPSFGSIRGTRETSHQEPVPEESGDVDHPDVERDDDEEANESIASYISEDIATSLPASSDHAIGGILKDAQREAQPAEHEEESTPVPADDAHAANGEVAKEVRFDENSTAGAAEDIAEPEPFVPAIAVEPATPEAEKGRASLEYYDVPGGFPRGSVDIERKTPGKKKSKRRSRDDPSKTTRGDEKPADGNETDESSGGSVYSDAAEDMDGDGFGSINAIVGAKARDRQAVAPREGEELKKGTAMSMHPKPSKARGVHSKPRDVEPDQIGRALSPVQDSAAEQAPDSPSATKPPPAKKPSTTRPMSVDAGSKRRPPPISTDSSGNSPRQASVRQPAEERKRPMSLGPTPLGGSAGDSPVEKPLRRASTRESGFAMRRTMRGSSVAERGPSPTGRPMPIPEERPTSSGSSAGKMRTTLRGSPQTGKTSFFSPGRPAQRASKPRGLFRSRFGDSDDENDGHRGFQSRFDDSSDDERPGMTSMRPVRGIPRRNGTDDGDSTDLEDSSEDERRRPPARPASSHVPTTTSDPSGLSALARSRGMTREELDQILNNPPTEKKPGLFSRFSKKKPKQEHVIRKSTIESASRRDTPLERTQVQREQLRGPMSNGYGERPQPGPSGTGTRLSKKSLKRHTMDDSWPLNSGAQSKPVQTSTSPASDMRRTQFDKEAIGSPHEDQPPPPPRKNSTASDVVISGAERKKRFPMLRKALGLRS